MTIFAEQNNTVIISGRTVSRPTCSRTVSAYSPRSDIQGIHDQGGFSKTPLGLLNSQTNLSSDTDSFILGPHFTRIRMLFYRILNQVNQNISSLFSCLFEQLFFMYFAPLAIHRYVSSPFLIINQISNWPITLYLPLKPYSCMQCTSTIRVTRLL